MSAAFVNAHPAETLVLHGFAALDLVDGTTAAGSPARAAGGDFAVTIDVAPRGLRAALRGARLVLSVEAPSEAFLPHGRDAAELIDLSAPAGTLVLVPRAPGAAADCGDELVVEGEADDGMRTAPPRAPLHVEGQVADASGRWLPRRFAVDLDRGEVATLPVWPTPAAAAPGSSGVIIARLWFGDDEGAALAPASFALAQLALKLSPTVTRTFTAQADVHGDLILAPGRVPPVAAGLPGYDATLTVRADPPADPQALLAVLPEAQTARALGDPAGSLPNDDVRWLGQLDFKFLPGQRVRLVTAGAPALLIQQP